MFEVVVDLTKVNLNLNRASFFAAVFCFLVIIILQHFWDLKLYTVKYLVFKNKAKYQRLVKFRAAALENTSFRGYLGQRKGLQSNVSHVK